MCLRKSTSSCLRRSSDASASSRPVGMDASTAFRDGRSTPVWARKWPNRGSSNTRVSDRSAKLYIVAVLPFLGPAQRATVRAILQCCACGTTSNMASVSCPSEYHLRLHGDVKCFHPTQRPLGPCEAHLLPRPKLA